jgi:D-3-phosphoglycerate dehydrogenase
MRFVMSHKGNIYALRIDNTSDWRLKMRKKILITPKSFRGSMDKAMELLMPYNYEIIENTSGKTYAEDQMLEFCSDIDGIIVGIDPISEKVLRNAKNLKAISKYGAGLDNVDLNVAEELGIQVDRALATNATSVAELAVGFFFDLARNIILSALSVKKNGWGRAIGREITGKTVGIVGLGAIGREVARMCSGLGMSIIAYDPYFKDNSFLEKNSIKLTVLEEVFKEADFISLHSPLTQETENMINKNTLALMKKSAYLVNTSRGGLIDEDALYEALSNGTIAGAAADVFSQEPAGEHKLMTLDNFILTAHIGAFTAEATEKMVIQSTKNLIRMLEGI